MIRSFIAIELPEETRQKLAAIQEQLKESRAGVRWVKPASIHLTLKFLGNILPEQVEGIAEAAAKLVQDEPPIVLWAGGLGGFLNGQRIKPGKIDEQISLAFDYFPGRCIF